MSGNGSIRLWDTVLFVVESNWQYWSFWCWNGWFWKWEKFTVVTRTKYICVCNWRISLFICSIFFMSFLLNPRYIKYTAFCYVETACSRATNSPVTWNNVFVLIYINLCIHFNANWWMHVIWYWSIDLYPALFHRQILLSYV